MWKSGVHFKIPDEFGARGRKAKGFRQVWPPGRVKARGLSRRAERAKPFGLERRWGSRNAKYTRNAPSVVPIFFN